MEQVLHCQDIEKYYGSKNNMTKALSGVTFSIDKAEFVGIMGPSGSGKTTLLNCISTIDTPTAGHIFVAGRDITTLRQRELSRFRRERMGFIFQDSNLLDTLTARENIALALTIEGVSAAQIPTRVEDAARHLGVLAELDKFPYQLSGGQKQRVAAARALIGHPSIILADEPTGALDSRNAKTLLESLEGMNREAEATILMVTHDSYAASYCQRILFLRDGRVFNEIVRGDASRKEFFERIIEVVSFLGGDGADVR